MNKKILIGTTLAVIIVLAGFSSIASAQTIKSNEMRINIFQQTREKVTNGGWQPGTIIIGFFGLIAALLILLYSLSIGSYWP